MSSSQTLARAAFPIFFLVALFLPAEAAKAMVTSSNLTASPASFQVGTQSTLTLSGPFQGETYFDRCDTPNYDQVIEAKVAMQVEEVRYRIYGPNGDTGKTGTFNYGTHFSVALGGQGATVACGSTDTNYSGFRVWGYEFFSSAVVDVSGLQVGDYTIYFDSREVGQGAVGTLVVNWSGQSGPSFSITEPALEPATIKVSSNLATNWSVSGPNSFWGSGTGASYSGSAGTYSISADDLSCYSKAITPSSSQTVGYGAEITFYITYSYNCSGSTPPPGGDPPPPPGEPPPPTTVPPPPPPPPSTPPNCSSVSVVPYKPSTDDTSGAFYVYAYGVQGATSMSFPTWTDAGGQDDDIAWYPGTYLGNNTWMATIDLARHPGFGVVHSHAYAHNASATYVPCGGTYFIKNQPDQAPVGVLDTSNCDIIGGWTYDPDTPSTELAVHFYKDGPAGSVPLLTNTQTIGYRPDVNQAYGISGNHGYTIFTPASLLDNAVHTIYAYGLNSGTGNNTELTRGAGAQTLGPCPPKVPTADISASPTSVAYNGPTTISWTSTYVASCSISPTGWTGFGGSHSQNLTTTTTYVLSCTGPWGDVSDSVTVTVGAQPQVLTTSIAAGSGTITSSPLGISCPSDCSESYPYGTNVTVTATPAAGYTFSGWGGSCLGSSPTCNLTMNAAKTANASFVPNYTLTTSISSGSGTISGTGISCPSDCTESYLNGTAVTLTAAPSSGYTFTSWGGNCSGSSPTCNLTMSAARSASAAFTAIPFNYSLSSPGPSNVIKNSGTALTPNVITKTYLAGTNQTVNLAVSGLPNGVTVDSISSQNCTLTCPSTIVLAVASNAPVGTFPIRVTGTPSSGSPIRTVDFNLVITGASFTVSCSANPGTVLLGQNVTYTATVTGGTGATTYTWVTYDGSGTVIPTSPVPTSNSYSRSYSTIGPKTTQVTVTRDGVQATCPATTVQVNFDPNFKEF